jgi:hypothetical protein
MSYIVILMSFTAIFPLIGYGKMDLVFDKSYKTDLMLETWTWYFTVRNFVRFGQEYT